MQKILLHTCCGPCATYVNKWLNDNGFEIKGLFYNPNIRPQEEYERRLLTMEYFATSIKMKVILEPNDIETTQGDCENCYRVRLMKTAEYAKKLGLKSFSTTLLISPYQKHELIKKVGEEISAISGVQFFYRDFREGCRESRKMAEDLKLYMQKYCGCGIELIAQKEKKYAQAN